MNRLTLLVLIPLIGACRSTAETPPEPARAQVDAREAWVQSLRERGLHPATVAFVEDLWNDMPPTDGLARADRVPSEAHIESVRISDSYGFICDGFTFTVHVDPLGGRYWITRDGGIAGWVEHFGPGELPNAEPVFELRGNLFADLGERSSSDDR